MTTSMNGTFDRTPLIAGNWKMNMDHVQGITLLQKLAWTLSDAKNDYNRVEVVRTVHDARLPLTVNAPDGAVVASAIVPYQLGVTCTR